MAFIGRDRKNLASIIGLAFLWPCLQSSGFYPLSIIPSVAEADPIAVARIHLAYSVALAAAFAAVVAAGRIGGRLEVLVRTKPAVALAFGACGVLGHAMLAASDTLHFQLALASPVMAASLLVAVFIALFVPLWGCRIADGGARQAPLAIAASFLASQAVLVAYCAAGLPTGPLLCACAAGTALCAALSVARDTTTGRPFGFSQLRELPWRMMALVILLVYFCIVYVRLQMTEFSGDAATSYKLFTSTVCLLTFAVVVVYMARHRDSDSASIVILIFLISVYMVALALTALIAGDANPLARRMLIAGEHCLEVFLWMALAGAVIGKRLSPLPVFALMGIVVVALPWMLSFDLRYLTAAGNAISSNDFSTAAVTIALCATALGTIAFLTSYALQVVRDSSQRASHAQQERAQQAFEGLGLTPRELEIAVLVSRGYSAKKIAEMLYISEPTAKSYTSRVYRKLGIHSKQELIDYADERTAAPR